MVEGIRIPILIDMKSSLFLLVAIFSMSQGTVYMYPPKFNLRSRVIETPTPDPMLEFNRPVTIQQKLDILTLLEQMKMETFIKLIEISKCNSNQSK